MSYAYKVAGGSLIDQRIDYLRKGLDEWLERLYIAMQRDDTIAKEYCIDRLTVIRAELIAGGVMGEFT